MDELDDEDLDEADDDESAAERALLVAAVCARREAELGLDQADDARVVDDEDGQAENNSAGLLAELPRSRRRLLKTLRENMEWIASGEAAGGACAAFERLQEIPSAFPYLDGTSSGSLTRERF